MKIDTINNLQSLLRERNIDDFNGKITLEDLKKANNGAKSFGEMFKDSIMEVNNLQKSADIAIQKLVSGESKNLHETMLAVEKANIAFKSMNQIRLKVIDTYREIMRMQV